MVGAHVHLDRERRAVSPPGNRDATGVSLDLGRTFSFFVPWLGCRELGAGLPAPLRAASTGAVEQEDGTRAVVPAPEEEVERVIVGLTQAGVTVPARSAWSASTYALAAPVERRAPRHKLGLGGRKE
jgi:hypothetical protein